MTEQESAQGAPASSTDPQLRLQKIYIKDCSFESPNSPQVFTQEWKPKVSLNLHTTANRLADNAQEVVLNVSVEAKMGENTAFLIEIEQAGIFGIEDCPEEEYKKILGKRCPSMLYPYAREAISDLIGKGGFPQLLLQPFDFEDLYRQAEAQQAQQAETPRDDSPSQS